MYQCFIIVASAGNLAFRRRGLQPHQKLRPTIVWISGRSYYTSKSPIATPGWCAFERVFLPRTRCRSDPCAGMNTRETFIIDHNTHATRDNGLYNENKTKAYEFTDFYFTSYYFPRTLWCQAKCESSN